MKNFLKISIILILTTVVALFIWKSNDHLECEIEVVISKGENGEKIVSNKHICNEKFNM